MMLVKSNYFLSTNNVKRILVVGNGSWKKRKIEDFYVGKFEMKFERMKLESSSRSWKIFNNLILNLKLFNFDQ